MNNYIPVDIRLQINTRFNNARKLYDREALPYTPITDYMQSSVVPVYTWIRYIKYWDHDVKWKALSPPGLYYKFKRPDQLRIKNELIKFTMDILWHNVPGDVKNNLRQEKLVP